MKVELNNLLIIQSKVDNETFSPDNKPTYDMIYFSMLVSFFKLSDNINTWKKFWNIDVIENKEIVLNHLVDVVSLYLSYMNSLGYSDLNRIDNEFEGVFEKYKLFPPNLIFENIAKSISDGLMQPPEAILIAAISISNKLFNIEWNDIEDAYIDRLIGRIDQI